MSVSLRYSPSSLLPCRQIANESDMSHSPPGSYTSTWPLTNRESFSATDKPPVLPPHLLNIILNKDTAEHVRTTFRCSYQATLFFPSTNQLSCLNRIMSCWSISTLYPFEWVLIERSEMDGQRASFQDGVIVLSTTTRYKQKFVTTCFYKPTDK